MSWHCRNKIISMPAGLQIKKCSFMCAQHPLRSTRLNRSRSGAEVADGKNHVTKLQGLKYDVWKHFAFSMSRNEKGEKATDK